MRMMTNGKFVLNIVEWIMTNDGSEYYVTDQQREGIALCWMNGFIEICLKDLEPEIKSRTKDLEVDAAIGWSWIYEDEQGNHFVLKYSLKFITGEDLLRSSKE